MQVLQRANWDGESKDLGNVFLFHKVRCDQPIEATCHLATQVLGWELRLEISDALQRSQLCRTEDDVLNTSEQWRAAMIRGDGNSVKALYSSQPPARISVITKGASEVSADSDTAFWTGLKARHMELKISQSQDPQPGVRQINFQATVRTAPPGRTFYVVETQVWQMQGESWKLVAAQRTDDLVSIFLHG